MADIGEKFLPMDAGPGNLKQLPVNVIPDAEWIATHLGNPVVNTTPVVAPASVVTPQSVPLPLAVVPVVPIVQTPAPVVAAPTPIESVGLPNSVELNMPATPARHINGAALVIGLLLLVLIVK